MKKRGWLVVLIITIVSGTAIAFGVNAWKKEKQANCEHQYVLESKTNATCEKDGARIYKCSECGKKSRETIEKLEHIPVGMQDVAATCDAVGYTGGVMCDVCKTVLTEQTVLPMTEHNFETAEIISATCTEFGALKSVCSECGKSKMTVLEPLGHTEQTVDEIAATCTKDGHESGIMCSVCQEIISGCETIYAPGHTLTGFAGDDCLACGEKVYLTNGYTVAEAVSGENVVGNWYRIYTTYYETNAGDFVPINGGSFLMGDDWTIYLTNGNVALDNYSFTKASECFITVDGIDDKGHYTDILVEEGITYTASYPGDVIETYRIEKNATLTISDITVYRLVANPCTDNHVSICMKGIEATCTTSGWSDGSMCLGCGEILIAKEEIEATGHNGEPGADCSNCGETIQWTNYTLAEVTAGESAAGNWYRLYEPSDSEMIGDMTFSDKDGSNRFIIWGRLNGMYSDDPDALLGDYCALKTIVGKDDTGNYVDVYIKNGASFSVRDDELQSRTINITDALTVESFSNATPIYRIVFEE